MPSACLAITHVVREKVCTKCGGDPQPIERFQADPRYTDGYAGHCRGCRSATVMRGYHRRRDEIRARVRPCPKCGDPTEPGKAYCAECRRQYARARYAANPEPQRKQAQRWAADNREWRSNRNTLHGVTRRMREAIAFVEHVDRRIVWDRDNGICGLCGKPADPNDWHLEHINPISQGGEHSYANTQVSHPTCNRIKGGRSQ